MPSYADFVPLCPIHNKRMVVSRMLEVYECESEGCAEKYDRLNGHFQSVNGAIQKKISKPYPLCGTLLYLAARGQTRLDDKWMCPNPACSDRGKR